LFNTVLLVFAGDNKPLRGKREKKKIASRELLVMKTDESSPADIFIRHFIMFRPLHHTFTTTKAYIHHQ
jgi:hypothetical protein